MAITSAIMQMRRGNEADFDPDKMHPGEWAVSTDEKYVRMCFSPGVCVRMATYEAFEEDMEQIIAILEDAKTVQEAIEKIYEEFQKAELDIEAAENSAILSESYAHGGTGTREGEDTDNAKYYAESVANTISDIALNRQTLGYVKKNLCNYEDFTIEAGTNNYAFKNLPINWGIESNKTYTASFYTDFTDYISLGLMNANVTEFGKLVLIKPVDGRVIFTFTTPEDLTKYKRFCIYAGQQASTVGNTLNVWDIQIELGDTATDYEPYVDDVNTRLENVETEVISISKYGVTADGLTDDTEAIQNFINDNAGNVLFFPEGTYRIANNIKIPSNTTLIGYGATILFEANNAMINASDGTIGGTVANKNINIVGFTFIANTTQNATSVAFGHANNCKVIDCTFSNNAGWHMIEVNSCDNVEIKSCVFKEYGILPDGTVSSKTTTEMVQVDYAYGDSGFPWFGPYDKTPCTNVYIDKCSFYGNTEINFTAIGNHSVIDVDVDVVKNVYITDCYFRDLSIVMKYVVGTNFIVDHCIADNVNAGILGSDYVKDVCITNNVFMGRNVAISDESYTGIRYWPSTVSRDADCIKKFTIRNNVITHFGYSGIYLGGYDHVIENNRVQYNHDSGIIIGYNNYNSMYRYNIVTENNARDVRFNSYDSGIYENVGGNIVSDNRIEVLTAWIGTPLDTRSYLTNNIIDTAASTSGVANLVRIGNIVGGVLES